MEDTKVKLVVVEDMEEVRELMRFYFEKRGYRVFTATSGEEALPIIKERCPDVMMLDIILPKMSGLELLRLVRQFNTTLKVILMSGALFEMPGEDELKELNFQEFLPKPVSISDLGNSVMRALAGLRQKER